MASNFSSLSHDHRRWDREDEPGPKGFAVRQKGKTIRL